MPRGFESDQWNRFRRRAVVGAGAVGLVAFLLTAGASSATASVTIGQLAPGSAPSAVCNTMAFDHAQPSVISGNTYVVPGTGTITSWSHNAASGGSQTLTMKIFRKVADPATFQVVGHDGPRQLAGGLLNTFPASIPVKPGDILGLNQASGANTACDFDVAGESEAIRNGNLSDGESGAFGAIPDSRPNISAVFAPSNTLTLGKVQRNRQRGTATITGTAPNPGMLTASGKGVKAASVAAISKLVSAPGKVKLLIKAKGKKKRTLNETGNVKLKVAVTYTPTNGDPGTQILKVKLKKKL